MKTYACLVAVAFSLSAAASVANAQVLVAQPYETVIIQPNATVIKEMPLFAVAPGQPVEIVSTVETVRTIHPATRAVVRHHVVARRKIQDRVATNYSGPLYNMAAAPIVQTSVAAPMGQGLSGQFQCIQGCTGLGGLAFVTQNGWDLNLVNEIGQPSRAWIDYPGHIWVQSWNEGAVYSPDGLTIQFDNGTVWMKNVVVVVPQLR